MNQLKYILIMLPVLFIWGGCEKDVKPEVISIHMKLEEPVRKGRTFIQLRGSLTEHMSVKETGFSWWTPGDRVHASEIVCWDSLSLGRLDVLLEGLEPDKSYEYCMYADNGVDRLTGQTGSFKTVLYGEPLLSELTADKEALNRFSCRVKDDGIDDTGMNLTSKGVCWNTEGNPTVEDSLLEAEGEDASFTVSIPGLQDSTTYYVRAFAMNDSSYLSYSSEVKIQTGRTLPGVGRIILADSLKKEFRASLDEDGGSGIISKGFCWNTAGMPTVDDNKKMAEDEFAANLSELSTGTLYYVRAFAENTYGIAYSEELAVKFISLPTVGAVERIDPETNTFRSSILENGGSEIREKGFCWNRTGSPSVADRVVQAGKDFVATITDMESGTYYIRAFAVNEAGVGYGEELSISIHVITIPVLDEVRVLDEEVYLLKCAVLSSGGSKVTANGFCWSTHDYPDFSDNILPGGDDFTAALGQLFPGVYYVRGYATNKVGTGYSRTLRLDTRTIPEIGEVETIDAVTHTYRFTLLSNGGGKVDKWGFCWNTAGNPGIRDHIVQGDTDFTATLGELLPGTYYIRAYAVNEIGVGYSKEFSITVEEKEEELPSL